jgi:hypothetical protein
MKQNYFIVLASAVFIILAASPAVAQQSSPYKVEYQTPQIYKDFRLSIGGGYAFRLGKIKKTGDAKLDDINKQLRHGFTVDADAQYFFRESWGLGVNANFCSSFTSGNNLTIPDFGTVNSYKESQNVLFLAPSFAGRSESEKFLLISSVAVGPIFYSDNMTFNGATVNGTTTTVGFNAGMSGEYKLNAKTGIGLKLSYTLGVVNSINVQGRKVKYDEPANVSNLMATVFLAFRTW